MLYSLESLPSLLFTEDTARSFSFGSCTCMSVCVPERACCPRKLEESISVVELELQMLVSCHRDVGEHMEPYTIPLLLFSECWDYRHELLAQSVLYSYWS